MQIELKNLQTKEFGEGLFFDGDLWIGGLEAGYVTFKSPLPLTIRSTTPAGDDLIASAHEYAKTLPAFDLPDEHGKMQKVEMTLENFIIKKAVSFHVSKELSKTKNSTKTRPQRKKDLPEKNILTNKKSKRR